MNLDEQLEEYRRLVDKLAEEEPEEVEHIMDIFNGINPFKDKKTRKQ